LSSSAEFFTLPAGTLLLPQFHWLIPFSDFTQRIVVQFQHKAIHNGDRSRKIKLHRVNLDQTGSIPNPSEKKSSLSSLRLLLPSFFDKTNVWYIFFPLTTRLFPRVNEMAEA
jgi:hypothetical protein